MTQFLPHNVSLLSLNFGLCAYSHVKQILPSLFDLVLNLHFIKLHLLNRLESCPCRLERTVVLSDHELNIGKCRIHLHQNEGVMLPTLLFDSRLLN